MTMLDGICECCKRKRPLVGVASSGIGPMSIAWCAECLRAGAEPLDFVRALDAGLTFRDQTVFHDGAYKKYGEVA